MISRGARLTGDAVRLKSKQLMKGILDAEGAGQPDKAAQLRKEMHRFGDEIVAWLDGTQTPGPKPPPSAKAKPAAPRSDEILDIFPPSQSPSISAPRSGGRIGVRGPD
eukprot:TRINITY_DN5489_c0_g1_i3.p1 TRINITY_DN5489_c0_g1~~TRINITY_DN5489_c0_g1_i3.p1  ORF type:complete len:108 (+),score=24.09 TRINITY_DN5489_c0_g1_i3:62-385(+)